MLRATVEEVKNVAEAAVSGDKKAANSPRNREEARDGRRGGGGAGARGTNPSCPTKSQLAVVKIKTSNRGFLRGRCSSLPRS